MNFFCVHFRKLNKFITLEKNDLHKIIMFFIFFRDQPRKKAKILSTRIRSQFREYN